MVYTERDVDIGVEGCKFAASLGETKAFKEAGITLDRTPVAGCTKFEHGTVECWKCTVRLCLLSFSHPAGTCKMGTPQRRRGGSELRIESIRSERFAGGRCIDYALYSQRKHKSICHNDS